jgi:hypothetical protein
MTIDISQTTAVNTFQYLINRVNELANAVSTQVVTTESNTTTGNASITNAFTANVLIAESVRVSNTTSNVVISVPNTQIIANGNYYLNASGNWTPLIIPITTTTTNTSGTTPFQQIDAYTMADIGAAEYFVRIKDNMANSYHASKLMTFHNNVAAFSTEYATMVSNVSLGTFVVDSNSTHVRLLFSPTSTNTSITISRVRF